MPPITSTMATAMPVRMVISLRVSIWASVQGLNSVGVRFCRIIASAAGTRNNEPVTIETHCHAGPTASRPNIPRRIDAATASIRQGTGSQPVGPGVQSLSSALSPSIALPMTALPRLLLRPRGGSRNCCSATGVGAPVIGSTALFVLGTPSRRGYRPRRRQRPPSGPCPSPYRRAARQYPNASACGRTSASPPQPLARGCRISSPAWRSCMPDAATANFPAVADPSRTNGCGLRQHLCRADPPRMAAPG